MERTEIIDGFRKDGVERLTKLTQKSLYTFILDANNQYTLGTPFLTDGEYDTILEFAKQNKTLKQKLERVIGAPVASERKTELPYFMGSMNKIKPDSGVIEQWKKDFADPYVISAKLDGVSGMYVCKNGESKLYTRGNGRIGQDISFLLPHFKLPYIEDIVVRGEFLISKEDFENKWKTQFSNPRNLVAGIINAKHLDAPRYADLKFICYEVIQPQVLPSNGFKLLKKFGFNVVHNSIVLMKQNLTNELLSKMLLSWREQLEYDIDGIIVTSDHIYSRKEENPKHSFAFKMILSEQMVEAHVIDVIWAASKDGYLKPRIKINPVSIGGATIEYATGFNGNFIEENKIGPGTVISLIRSGDVIPHIHKIIQSAMEPSMPKVPYKWTDNHVDIYIDTDKLQKTTNIPENTNIYLKQINVKNLLCFFKGLQVNHLSIGNLTKLVENGYNTVGKIVKMNPTAFAELDGFGDILGEKISSSIRNSIKNATLIDIMIYSNQLGRTLGPKKIALLMNEYPNVLLDEITKEEKTEKIIEIKGFAEKTAKEFVDRIPIFIKWIQQQGLKQFLSPKYLQKNQPISKKTPGIFTGVSFIFTGFRDKELEDKIISKGGTITSSLSKQTGYLIYKEGAKGSKVEKATALGIKTVGKEEFVTKYM